MSGPGAVQLFIPEMLFLHVCHCGYWILQVWSALRSTSYGALLLWVVSSISLVYLYKQLAKAVSLCLAGSTASGVDSYLYFLGTAFFIAPLCTSDILLTSLHTASILASSLLLCCLCYHCCCGVAVRIVHYAAFTSSSRPPGYFTQSW